MGRKIEDKRSFTVEVSSNNRKGGRYLSKSPFGAARKAATKLFKDADVTEVRFILRETTKSSMSTNAKHYYYAKKSNDNREIKKKDATYIVTTKVDVKSLNEGDVSDLLKKINSSPAQTAPQPQAAPQAAPQSRPSVRGTKNSRGTSPARGTAQAQAQAPVQAQAQAQAAPNSSATA
jgi:hypothetical protein